MDGPMRAGTEASRRAPTKAARRAAPPARSALARAFAARAPGWLLAGVLALGARAGLAADASLAACRALDDPAERLACYDRLAGAVAPADEAGAAQAVTSAPPSAAPPAAIGAAPSAAPSAASPAAPTLAPGPSETAAQTAAPVATADAYALLPDTPLGRRWELRAEDKRGSFHVTDYRANFFLPLHFSDRLNTTPSSPAPDHTARLGTNYRRVETKLQLSMRAKILEGAGLPGSDLWIAYTQTSLWQLWNHDDSAPFRSTDHEPELIYVLPVSARLGTLALSGWRLRMLDARLTHQSNGQSLPLSRSWNRVSLGAALENPDGEVNLHARVWHRLHERDGDDNPDLVDWRGRGEVILSWTPGLAAAALQWRTTFGRLDRGSLQLDWTYPVNRDQPQGLRWYAQIFTGYGETLQDYNFSTTSIGFGLSLFRF